MSSFKKDNKIACIELSLKKNCLYVYIYRKMTEIYTKTLRAVFFLCYIKYQFYWKIILKNGKVNSDKLLNEVSKCDVNTYFTTLPYLENIWNKRPHNTLQLNFKS